MVAALMLLNTGFFRANAQPEHKCTVGFDYHYSSTSVELLSFMKVSHLKPEYSWK